MTPMTQTHRQHETRTDVDPRWAALIERLVSLYQAKFGYSRAEATSELVRKLSSSVLGTDEATYYS